MRENKHERIMWRTKQTNVFRFALSLGLLLAGAISPNVYAQQSSSTNYSVNEVFFGTGGDLNECSTSYCAKVSAGETTVGNTSSTNYQAQGGFNTDRTPSLTFVVNTTNINLGTLTPGTAKTANSTFSVQSYLSNGYIVQTLGTPPTNSSHALTPLTTATTSNTSAEQFGINLAANTSPATFGAVPAQVPSTTFGFGTAASGYGTTNLYKYNSGDTIAQSLRSSGETDFTISYIFNTTNLTPGGQYTMNQSLVATATF